LQLQQSLLDHALLALLLLLQLLQLLSLVLLLLLLHQVAATNPLLYWRRVSLLLQTVRGCALHSDARTAAASFNICYCCC
jgi:hypothetical protein